MIPRSFYTSPTVFFLPPGSRARRRKHKKNRCQKFSHNTKRPLFAIVLYVQCMRNAGKGAKDHDSCGALTQHKAIGKTYSKP